MKEHFLYLYSDEFWYSSPNYKEIIQSSCDLYLSSKFDDKPIIWHLAHIVHKEEFHIVEFAERPKRRRMHTEWDPLLIEGKGLEKIKELIPNLDIIIDWHNETRKGTINFIKRLSDDEFDRVQDGSFDNLSIANWLGITQVHTGLHIGRIQNILLELEKR